MAVLCSLAGKIMLQSSSWAIYTLYASVQKKYRHLHHSLSNVTYSMNVKSHIDWLNWKYILCKCSRKCSSCLAWSLAMTRRTVHLCHVTIALLSWLLTLTPSTSRSSLMAWSAAWMSGAPLPPYNRRPLRYSSVHCSWSPLSVSRSGCFVFSCNHAVFISCAKPESKL